MFDIFCGLGCGEITCHVWPVTMQNVMTSLKENLLMYRKITQAFTLDLAILLLETSFKYTLTKYEITFYSE